MKRALFLVAATTAFAWPVAATASGGVAIRHVDLTKFPLVRVTALAPGASPTTLLDDGRPAAFANARELGSGEAIVLAVDNSESMQGRPLREAKRAALDFLAREHNADSVGLVAFGHEALPLTRADEAKADVSQTLAALAPDTQTGTSLYDAVESSVVRLRRASSATRILVLLTDGRDVGSRSSLGQAVAAAERANVVVYAIAAGIHVDRGPLAALAEATGGRVFAVADVNDLRAAYAALGRELDHTWQISFLSRARPGDRVTLTVRAAGAEAASVVRIPGQRARSIFDLIPTPIVHRPGTAVAIVALAALLLAGTGVAVKKRLQKPEISRLLHPHLERRQRRDEGSGRARRVNALLEWTEHSIAELPGAQRLARAVESSGLKTRVGHLPYIGGSVALLLAILGTAMGAGPLLTVGLMVVGLATPIPVLRIAAHRRTQAFDRQLPDVLATVASTLRAGHGLRAALRGIANDGSPPASAEFTRTLGEERLGRPLDQAVAAICERIDSPDLEYVATAIKVQSQAGGSLAALFDTLSETVRERQRHASKVRALTSMGRMSATILLCLPFVLAALMTLISPAYMSPFFRTSTGHVLIGFCLVSMTIGALVLKRIVNVRY
jgi:tight adherence protein B